MRAAASRSRLGLPRAPLTVSADLMDDSGFSMRPTYLSPAGPQTSLVAGLPSHGLRHLVQRAGTEYRELLTALVGRVRDLASLLAPPGPVIPRAPLPGRHRILFLAANPSETTRLALDEECAAIERELRMTTGRDAFEFRSKWAASIDQVMRDLNELQPTVIHFSGHGCGIHVHAETHRDVASSAGIQLQDERRRPQHVSARALSQMIASAAPSARLVVLNACFSDTVAEALRGVDDCIVGMRGAISDDAARSFAVGFYRALGHGRSVGNAVEQAVATLAAKQLPDEHLPICRTRRGLSAAHFTLAA